MVHKPSKSSTVRRHSSAWSFSFKVWLPFHHHVSCSGRVCDGKSSSDGLVGCPTIGCIQRMKLHASTRVSMSSKFWKYTVRYDWARFVPRPQAHSVGKVYAGLGHPNTFLWSTCSEQRQTAVLHRFNFCMFCSKNSWTCVKQQGNQGSIVTHSKNLKDMFLRMFIHLHIHIVMLHIITR